MFTGLLVGTAVQAVTSGGSIRVPAEFSLTIPEPVIDSAPASISITFEGGIPETEVTFSVGGVEIDTQDTDESGDIFQGSIAIPDTAPFDEPGVFILEAEMGGTVAMATFTILNEVEVPVSWVAPDLPPQPVVRDDASVNKWILQDPMPDGIGSWEMPFNPVSSDPFPVTRNVVARHTTAPSGQFHLYDGWLNVTEWSFAGYCPNKDFYDDLVAYAALHRRIFLFDHRERVWTIAIRGIEVVPRKRQALADGQWNDWAGDYTVQAVIFTDRGWQAAP